MGDFAQDNTSPTVTDEDPNTPTPRTMYAVGGMMLLFLAILFTGAVTYLHYTEPTNTIIIPHPTEHTDPQSAPTPSKSATSHPQSTQAPSNTTPHDTTTQPDTPPQRPSQPTNMRFETPDGMEAFAQYALDVLEYTWMSGDTSLLEEISLDTCSWCLENIANTHDRAERGDWVSELDFTVIASGQAFAIEEHPHLWHIDVTFSQSAFKNFTGNELKTYKEKQADMSFQAQYQDGMWKLYEAGKLR